ncbi:MAG: SAM-dependent chlorinase/fluorinase [Bacteroidales bacterium]|nr:SAM-dependent chlorinase/fluorinase [Bacteroidales bacterium]
MPIITLTSDWGYKDPYLGAVKGAILSKIPGATIVDISHRVPSFNIEQAAYILKNVYPEFPDGTIHILAINTEESDKEAHTAVFTDNQYFIGTDNGIFSLIFDKKPEAIVELTIPQESGHFTFSTRDRFINAAMMIANGKKLQDIGTLRQGLNEKILFEPVITGDIIKGHVIYIDNYENVITNIKETLFKSFGKGRRFSISIRTHEINKISTSYNDVPPGEILALFASGGLMEIAMNQGNASGLLGIKIRDLVRIEFFNS